jgi:hypothetical protein
MIASASANQKKSDKQEWAETLEFFKKNPKALMDAIPTPRGEEEKMLKEFKMGNGLTPKGDMNFRFNDTSSSFNFKSRMQWVN